ncbi:hypothetical protein FGADI_6754 [Fusarium gaditjirri]|uniref:Ankyrin n=1 Tax=Fusarium gaditjirri TaxID=282569 RepID=A0A8H4WWL7_9HYPO|nr:hypothetical protein FGADI_6754 [Fusarium gaditjirri]
MADSDSDAELECLSPAEYTVGWICALPTELQAARAMLDERHRMLQDQPRHDTNNYILGRIKRHNIVIASLPFYGTDRAAVVANSMQSTFPGLRFVLMVGIGGGVHSSGNDIRLGDIVVSYPEGQGGGVIQYDLGREETSEFRRVGHLNAPPDVLLKAVMNLRSHFHVGKKVIEIVQDCTKRTNEPMSEWTYPGTERDILFQSKFIHIEGNHDCNQCIETASPTDIVQFQDRQTTYPRIFYGNIGSGNTVMKSSIKRDHISRKENVICFEMEAAGLMGIIPCLVIRGISDYADSHKNKAWQPYAAVMAAAYAKRLLQKITPQAVEKEKTIKDISSQLEQVSELINKLESREHSREDESILEWIATAEYQSQHNSTIKMRQGGTCQWFLNSNEFQAWLKTEDMVLFCPGIPGAGKTILTSVVVEKLLNQFRNDGNIGIAFVYCDIQRKDEQKAQDLLASLLKQLCQYRSSLPDAVKSLYTTNRDRRTRPSLDELSRTLKSVVLLYARTFLIVDALDECQHQEQFVTEILALQKNTRSNLFVTSRPIKSIEKNFDTCSSLDVHAKNEDVMAYIDNRILELKVLQEDNKDMQEDIKSELKASIKRRVVDSVHGMFLLARFHLDSLVDKTTPRGIKNALQKLPTGLNAYDQAYGKTVKRISNQQPGFRNLARRVLLWLTCTERPLTTLELRHALAVKNGNTTLDQDDFESTSVMVDVCMGLVKVEEGSGIVRLLHYTTLEYFQANIACIFSLESPEALESLTLFEPQVNETFASDVQREITITCVAYLSLVAFSGGCCDTDKEYKERHATYNFFEYAAMNWGHHARKASFPLEEVMSFLRCSESMKTSSHVMAGIEEIHLELYGALPVEIPGLHLAAFFGIEKAVKELVEDDPNRLDVCSRTPLFYAAARGHEAVVSLLLEMDESLVDFEDQDGQTPLMRAAENGHEMVVQKLLRTKKVDVNQKDRYGRTALSRAVWKGRTKVVKLLLAESKIDITEIDDDGQSLLSDAAMQGHQEIVSLLLKTGKLDPNHEDDMRQTPLSLAAAEGHEGVVKLLLSTDEVEADAEDSFGMTPLCHAAEGGHKAVAELLLRVGKVDVNGKFCAEIPIEYAATHGHRAVFDLLLSTDGIDLKTSLCYKGGQSLLSYAADVGDVAVMRMLLTIKLSINEADFNDDGESPFLIDGYLVKRAHDVNISDSYGNIPLLIAAKHGHQEIVNLLLKHGGDVNCKDRHGKTALFYATENGHFAVVEQLLKTGAGPR